jgi:cytochrome P450/NADPH-cytochrome P450 reductase
VFSRISDTDTVIGGRFRVPAGQPVSVVVPALHRDPVWGPNVEAFDPDRFTPERASARPPHAYKPFGTGERACIGNRFALHEATLVLGLLLHRYTLDDYTNYQLKIVQALTIKPEGFTLRLRRRTPQDRAVATPAVPAAGAPATTMRAPGTPLLVLHGSNLGSTRRWADTLGARAEDAGFTVTRGALDDAADGLPIGQPVLLVAASYNGRPTDDAEKFVARLESAADAEFTGVRYGVLGVGDRNWSVTYQRIPTLIDDRLTAGGAQRLVERGEADNSIGLAAGAEPWIDGTLAALLDEFGEETTEVAPSATGYQVRELDAPDVDTALHAGTLTLTVEENRPLTDEGRPGRTKRLVRLTLPEGQRYRTGDQLVVRVANPDALVDRALAAFDLDGDRWVSVEHGRRDRADAIPAGVPITVRRLLRETVELLDPASAAATRRLAELNPCPPEAATLATLADQADRPTLVELVERNPALRGRLDLATLLDLLEPLRTRTYSISSSPAVSPSAIDLLVAVLEYDTPDGAQRRGIGSGHLAALRPGDRVRATLQPCREVFRVDPHATEPTVLVAAGSGLAPFRGAVADRMHARAHGAEPAPLTLYFGCDDPELDYLHRAELEAAAAAGAVTLHAAFSDSPDGGVRFAQHAMARDADTVWSALQAGGRVLVCGDARRLAPGVRDVLTDLFQDRTGGSAEQAQTWLADLGRDGRYVEDVYAA